MSRALDTLLLKIILGSSLVPRSLSHPFTSSQALPRVGWPVLGETFIPSGMVTVPLFMLEKLVVSSLDRHPAASTFVLAARVNAVSGPIWALAHNGRSKP